MLFDFWWDIYELQRAWPAQNSQCFGRFGGFQSVGCSTKKQKCGDGAQMIELIIIIIIIL